MKGDYANWFNSKAKPIASARQWRWWKFGLSRFVDEGGSVQTALTLQWGKPAKSIMLSFKRFA